MRQNLPVTQQMKNIPEHYRLMSRTDLNGTIIEVNYEFTKISGFNEAELIGQPQNILRHPDVPEAVFADMWDNLKQGKSWTQVVKNRTKNGDHYWVKANVKPIVENGQATGYISVRKPATPAEIEATIEAYQNINNKKWMMKDTIIRTPNGHLWQKLNPYNHLSIMGKA